MSSVAYIRIDDAEALSEFIRQPCLFDTLFFKYLFYAIPWLIHVNPFIFDHKDIKYNAIKR